MIQTIDEQMIEFVKGQALSAPNKRSRIILSEHKDGVQEMVIALCKGSYVRPHRHPFHKSESYHLMEGEMDVLMFSPDGDMTQRIALNGKRPLYRMKHGWFHQPVALTDVAVYHEVLQGPFNKELDVQYAPWAAEEI
jgi:glucose-6-phosphate isomerase